MHSSRGRERGGERGIEGEGEGESCFDHDESDLSSEYNFFRRGPARYSFRKLMEVTV